MVQSPSTKYQFCQMLKGQSEVNSHRPQGLTLDDLDRKRRVLDFTVLMGV